MAAMFAPTASAIRPSLAVAQRTSLQGPAGILLRQAKPAAVRHASRRLYSSSPPATSTRLVSLSSDCLNLKKRTAVTSSPSSLSTVGAMALAGSRRCAFSSSSSSLSASTSPSPSLPTSSRPAAQRDAAIDAAAAAAVSKAQQAAHSDLPPLDWNTFFQLRKTRRRIQLVFSIVGGLSGGLAGGLFLGSGIAEPLIAQVPLDPFLTLGLMTFAFSSLGWLVGPSVGNVVFYAWKRQYRAQMTLKETQFFARVKKNRVDPSASSAGNPVPDFYGEKISSVAGYRQWLKDQRAFNKKRTTFV